MQDESGDLVGKKVLFFGIFFSNFTSARPNSSCQSQMPHDFCFSGNCQTQVKHLCKMKVEFWLKKVWFFGIFNQFYKCKTKLQKKNQCYLILILVFFLEPQVKQLIQSSRHFLPNSLFTSQTKRPGSVT